VDRLLKDNFALDPDLLLCCAVVKTLYVKKYNSFTAAFTSWLFISSYHRIFWANREANRDNLCYCHNLHAAQNF
jgi:hypothetical protein